MLLDEIVNSVEIAYEDFGSPRFDFVAKAESKKPYAGIIEQLKTDFEIIETTDTNSDVSFFYYCTSRKRKQNVSLRMSMVGRYGLVNDDKYNPLTNSRNVDLKSLFALLSNENIQVLPKGILEQSVPLHFECCENTTVFNALFAPDEKLPWYSTIQ